MPTRALVLSGGGPVGVAWQTGIAAGLVRAGVGLHKADHVVGTSAGAIVGARLSLADAPDDLAKLPLSVPEDAPTRSVSPDRVQVREVARDAMTAAPEERRRAIGAMALAADTMSEVEFLSIMKLALGASGPLHWPSRSFACTSIDAYDGSFQLWTRASEAELVQAVASSCAVAGYYPPVTVQGRRYIDGGYRSMTNADLAAGHELVVLLAINLAGLPASVRQRTDAEVHGLRRDGATVVTITPDAHAWKAMGPDLLALGRSAAAARAGLAQAEREAAALARVWG